MITRNGIKLLITLLLTISCLIMTGCSRVITVDQDATEAANTAVALTIQAAFTKLAPTPTPIIIATATITTTPCENVFTFIDDVTVQDEDNFSPGATFTKVWRVKNVGTCVWTTAYSLAFYKDDTLGGPASVPLAANVAPGQTVDLSVNLTAPTSAGRYTSKWSIKDANGLFFFSTLENPVWVIIDVIPPSSGN